MKLGVDCIYFTLICQCVEYLVVSASKDYYSILGISRSSSDREIKRSFRKLAVKYHPDKNKSSDAEIKFRDIAEAHEVLSDDKKRKIYDQYGEAGLKDQAGFDGSSFEFNFNDFFQDFPFGGGGEKRSGGGGGGGGGFFSDFFEEDDSEQQGDSFFGNHFGFGNRNNEHEEGEEVIFPSHDNMEFNFGSDSMFGDFDGGDASLFSDSSSSSSGRRCRTITKRVGNMVMTSTDCS